MNAFECGTGIFIATSTSVTGAGAFAGGLMVAHGVINGIVNISKIVITTIAADKFGDDYADRLDKNLPDTAIGVFGYLMATFSEQIVNGSVNFNPYSSGVKEKFGAFGDILDIALGYAISANCGKNLIKQNFGENSIFFV